MKNFIKLIVPAVLAVLVFLTVIPEPASAQIPRGLLRATSI